MQRQSASWIVCLSLCSALLACSKDEAPPASETAALPAAENPAVAPSLSPEAAAPVPAPPAEEPKTEAAEPEVAAAEPAGDKPAEAEAPAKEGDEKAAEPKKSDKKKGDKAAEEPAKESKPKFTELGVKVTKAGTGTAASTGRQVTLHYRASLVDAEKPFDSTFAANRPLEVLLSPDAKLKVIEGLRRGLEGLMPGSEARLEIPASLAWGEKGNPAVGVPANSDVVFEVQVLDVQ